MEKITAIKKRAEELDDLLSSNNYGYQFNEETSKNIFIKITELKNAAAHYYFFLNEKMIEGELTELEDLFIWPTMCDVIENTTKINVDGIPYELTHGHIAGVLDELDCCLYSIERYKRMGDPNFYL